MSAKSNKALRAHRVECGLCVRCGEPAGGRYRCSACRAKDNSYKRGECRWCHKPSARVYCKDCTGRLVATSRKRREARRSIGVCIDCNKPAIAGRIRCETHLAVRRREAAAYGKRHLRPRLTEHAPAGFVLWTEAEFQKQQEAYRLTQQ